jgi:SAM-dependent methyltransferase
MFERYTGVKPPTEGTMTTAGKPDYEGGARFAFGANWSSFLALIDEERIREAEQSLRVMLNTRDLTNMRFLDIGSGSGLFSLAARRLGAKVHSFDYDPHSVACTSELKRRFFPDDGDWQVEQGSALDATFISRLGKFDVVYSWGVLHHTGALWLGLENAISRVAVGGQLYIAIYNDQGAWSRAWWLIKYIYNMMPKMLRSTYAYGLWYSIIGLNILKYTLMLRPMLAIRPLLTDTVRRGMSQKHDILDWMGGFPFEYARYDVLIDYLEARGFSFQQGRPNQGIGCHELVLTRL